MSCLLRPSLRPTPACCLASVTQPMLRPGLSDARFSVASEARKGKKKRKKKSKKSKFAYDSESDAEEAPRVGKAVSPVSVRKQIWYVRKSEERQKKELEHESATAKTRMSKVSWKRAAERKEIEAVSARRELRRQVDDTLKGMKFTKVYSPGLTSIFHTCERESGPVLLVDGYNVLFKRKQMRLQQQQRQRRRRGGEAGMILDGWGHVGNEREQEPVEKGVLLRERKALEERVEGYAGYVETRAVIAWDALGSKGARPWRPGFVAEERPGGLKVVYTDGMEADTFLVRVSRELVAQGAEYVIVATSDTEAAAMSAGRGVYTVCAEDLLSRMRAWEEEDALTRWEKRVRASALQAGANEPLWLKA